jgi:hypothetical protein
MMQIRIFLCAISAAALTACGTVKTMDGSPLTSTSGDCQVTVYQTRAQAMKNGEIEELCLITGSSVPSFVHTIETAIEKHKNKACSCGATNVFVESRNEVFMGPANVTMVAFKYVNKSK